MWLSLTGIGFLGFSVAFLFVPLLPEIIAAVSEKEVLPAKLAPVRPEIGIPPLHRRSSTRAEPRPLPFDPKSAFAK